jgi:hypothetical protein
MSPHPKLYDLSTKLELQQLASYDLEQDDLKSQLKPVNS